jgi:hypothetical protein
MSEAISTLEEIEQGGAWISLKNSGKKNQIPYWRKLGLLVEGRDFQPFKVLAPREFNGPCSVTLPLFRVSRVEELAESAAQKSQRLKDARSVPIREDDRMLKTDVIQEFRVDQATLDTLIESGKVRAEKGPGRVVFVSRSDCNRERDNRRRRRNAIRLPKIPKGIAAIIKRLGCTVAELRANVLPDGIPLLYDRSKIHGLEWNNIVYQLAWDPHPLIGERLALSLTEFTYQRGDGDCRTVRLQVSDGQLKAIADLLAHPLNKSLPGNKGVWKAEGLYCEEGADWCTDANLKERYGLTYGAIDHYEKRGVLKTQMVVWPSTPMKRDGKIRVSLHADAERIDRKRRGKELDAEKPAGRWLVEGLVWKDTDGNDCYTAKSISEQLGVKYVLDLNGPKYEELIKRYPPRKIDRKFPLREVFVFSEEVRCTILGEPIPEKPEIAIGSRSVSEHRASEKPKPTPAISAPTDQDTMPREKEPLKNPGGRPKGNKPETEKRKREMLDAWDMGEFGHNKSKAGQKHGFHRSDATKIINKHERAKRRK